MSHYTGLEIAVIGMAGKFPGAENVREFWTNLANGTESVAILDEQHIIKETGNSDFISAPNYVKVNSFIEKKEFFDADFFGYRPEEAALMDPQIRLFHEVCWHAIEDGGYNVLQYPEKIGLFAGANVNLNWQAYSVFANKDNAVDDFSASLLRNISYLCSTVAYRLNLSGPVCYLNTACSTSLVAIHQACISLLLRDCKMALAGGITINNHTQEGYYHEEGMIYSRDGHCRTFDRDASGTIGAEGSGVVLLKRLDDAIKDRDHIYAIIKGGAINNDGHQKVSFTAPSSTGQYKVIAKAIKTARIEPQSISYIEAHGTGTNLGDPIEVEALNMALGKSETPYCALGSLKSNLGHMDAAAGVGGFIKTALSLHHRKIPASLHYKNPNPGIDFSGSPLFVNTVLRDWANDKYPLRAGVSSFGIGGTNAHVILEEAPVRTASSGGRSAQLLVFSGKSPQSLLQNIKCTADFLLANPGTTLADAAYILQTGRTPFKYRKTFVCESIQEFTEAALKFSLPGAIEPISEKKKKKLVFLFPGQGAQYAGMFESLYQEETIFRDEIKKCLAIIKAKSGIDLQKILFKEGAEAGASELINQTAYTQPCIFVVEYALAKLLMEWGVQPDMMIGHSIGEYVAACISGIFSLEDCLTLIMKRGELMQGAPTGAMLSVQVQEEVIPRLLQQYPGISLAAVNSSETAVLSGDTALIEKIKTDQESADITCRVLKTSHAFHSSMLDGMLDEFRMAAAAVKKEKPVIPIVSNLTGTYLTAEQAVDASYWSRHLRETVLFNRGMETILADENALIIEVGPGKTLSGLVRSSRYRKNNQPVVTAGKHSQEEDVSDTKALLKMMGELWNVGIEISWERFYAAEQRNRIPLPGYRFEKIPYPVNVNISRLVEGLIAKDHTAKNEKISEWFYFPTWELAPFTPNVIDAGARNILFCCESAEKFTGIIDKLRSQGASVITAISGKSFEKLDPHVYQLDPGNTEEINLLLTALSATGFTTDTVIHAWSGNESNSTFEGNETIMGRSFFSLVAIIKNMVGKEGSVLRKVVMLTQNLHPVLEKEQSGVMQALGAGYIKVLSQEFPAVATCHIDIDTAGVINDEIVADFCEEIISGNKGRVITYRHGKKWERSYSKIKAGKTETTPVFRQEGVYVITGGLGKAGYALAAYLLQEFAATVILTGRTDLPAVSQQPNQETTPEQHHSHSEKLERLNALVQLGKGRVMYHACNTSNQSALNGLLQDTVMKHGNINGVIHAAGETPGEPIQLCTEFTEQQYASFFEAKVKGIENLCGATEKMELDFVLLCSSIAAVLGGIGFGAYAPANNYMDYFVQQKKNNNQCKNWIVVNLDGLEPEQDHHPKLIGKKELIEVIKEAIALKQYGQLIVSVNDLKIRLDNWIYQALPESSPAQTGNNFSGEESLPATGNAGVATDQQRLLQLWKQFFGKDTIGADDDFFDIGGDSLKALTIIRRITKAFGVEISIKEFFNNATVASLYEVIKTRNGTDIDITANAGFSTVPAAQVKEFYLLSPAQLRMYFLQELEKDSVAYNLPHAVLLKGEISPKAIEVAFEKVIRHHEILRTCIVPVNGEIRQKVMTDFEFNVEYETAANRAPEDIIKSFVRPFQLSQCPLLRACLVQVTEEEAILIVDIHHIVTDGVSYKILINDFAKAYAGETLSPATVTYKDFAEWRQGEEQQVRTATQKQFWIKEFEEEVAPLELPIDFPRPKIKSTAGAVHGFSLTGEQTAALRKIAAAENVSLFMLLFAAYNVLLSKLGNSEDVVVGTVTSGRPHADLENVMGMFVNTLPVRNFPKGELTFTTFLHEVKLKMLTAIDNQDYQYYEMLEELAVVRDNSRNPLFDTAFVYENSDRLMIELPELTVTGYETGSVQAKFDLMLTAAETAVGIDLIFEYCTSLFNKNSIAAFSTYYEKIINTIIAGTDISLAAITILDEKEQEYVFSLLDNTAVNYPHKDTVASLFEKQVERSPDNIAVKYGAETLTYRELNDRANRLALYLQQQGVLPNSLVALLMDKSVAMIVGIMGILKAGAAYLPLDVDYPAERIEYLLTDSGTNIMVGDPEWMSNIRFAGLFVDYTEVQNSVHDTASLIRYNDPSQLCYVIYTSGTTGNPKGVMISNRNVVRLFCNDAFQFDFGQQDVWTLFHSQCFDFSVWEIFGALLFGGRLIIIPKTTARDTADFLRVLQEENVTVLNQTPGAFYNLQEEAMAAGINNPALRYVIFGGEALIPGKLQYWVSQFPEVKMVNMFGITETTVHVTYKEIGAKEIDNNISNVGKPIPTLSVCLLNSHQQLVPKGTVGEIYVGGDGVALGYLNRKELTEARFIQHPYQPGKILYRSGDLGRITPDGDIEYLGRIDQQVKIRGFRIELGEIEYQLKTIPYIKETVVLAADKGGTRQLVAYIVSDITVEPADLRSHLQKNLPDYMVPSIFVQVEKIPLNANGKVDRKQLPVPEGNFNKVYTPPSTFEEKLLAGIWEKVLGLDKAGITDNFFSIGGDSIKSIQIIARTRTAGYEISVKDIFVEQTIQGVALKMKPLQYVSAQEMIAGDTVLTPIQEWFFQTPRIHYHHYNQSVLLQFNDTVTPESVQAIFKKIQDHHDALRLIFIPSGEDWKAKYTEADKTELSLDVFDLRSEPDPSAAMTARCNSVQQSISLTKGPLMKLAFFKLPGTNRLLIAIHHLVIDGVSWRILFEDIQTLHSQLNRKETLLLPPKTDSFHVWAEKIREYVKTPAYREGLAYWKVKTLITTNPIPGDTNKPAGNLRDIAEADFELNSDQTSLLLKETHHRFGTQINDILLAALFFTIKQRYQLSSVAVAMEGHGREDIVEGVHAGRTIGWFTNLYPLCIELPDGETAISTWIKFVKEEIRRIPNKGMDYLIAAYLQQEKVLRKINPGICFNYLGQFDSDVKDQDYSIAEEFNGHNRELDNTIDYRWEISALVSGGLFRLKLFYDANLFYKETIEAVLLQYKNTLLRMIEICCKYTQKELTPTDLTYKKLTIVQLDKIQLQGAVQDIYTLSPMQEGLLFHSLANEKSAAYFEQMTYRWEGVLDKEALLQTMTRLVERHAVLRTSFLYKEFERPLQAVWKNARARITFIDARMQYNGMEGSDILKTCKLKDREVGFDLSSPDLLRLTVLQTEDSVYHFIWSHHHILMDGWCMGIIVNDFRSIYVQEVSGKKSILGNVEPYSGYIGWLEKQDKQASAEYWKNYLEDYENIISFPGKKNAGNELMPADHTSYRFELGAELTSRVKLACSQCGVTMNMFMQAVWGILVSKYNNCTDIVFGAVVSGRPGQINGIEKMVGLFINTIPVRVKYETNESFKEVLLRVKAHAISGEPYHYHPLSAIQSMSQLKTSLINHILVFENYPLAEAVADTEDESPGNYAVTDLEVFEQTNYDLSVMLIPGESLIVDIHFNERVYDRDMIGQIEKHFTGITQSAISDINTAVAGMEYLHPEERDLLLARFNDTAVEYDMKDSVIDLFEKQVEQRPGSTAVRCGSSALTYEELNKRANVYAAQLSRQMQVLPNDVIAFMAEPSVDMIAILLAILKLGCTYLALSPDAPPARNRLICEDANIKLLLIQQHVKPLLDETGYPAESAKVVVPDESIFTQVTSVSYRRLPVSESQIYILYTSGTTGAPKGVEVKMSGILNMIHFYENAFSLKPGMKVSQVANILFDASAFEIWPCLTRGGELNIAPPEVRMDVNLMERWLINEGIEITFQPPVIAEMLLRSDAFIRDNHSLKIMNVAGDIFNYAADKKLGFRLFNLYGPTEDSVWTTWLELTSHKPNIQYSIGKPIANKQLFILDRHLQLLPVNVTGELYISGKGLAKGYINNAALNAEKFIPNPYLSGQIMYKTGDLARWSANGEIEFIGRADFQVKIRGFRIETGEIETAMQEIETIQQVAVVPFEKAGQKQLVAYFTADAPVSIEKIKAALNERLPGYMVPSFFMQLSKLPYNHSGKLDRRALPEPVMQKKAEYTSSGNKVYTELISIWSDVLELDTAMISVTDNFFDIGGNSIKLMQMVNAVNNKFNSEITVAAIFKLPFIAKIAEFITGNQQKPVTNSQPATNEKLKNTLNVLKKARQNKQD